MKWKRRLKIAGLSALLASAGLGVISSAVNGGVGFGVLVILCYFLCCVCLSVLCIFSVKSYKSLSILVKDLHGEEKKSDK